MSTFCCSPPDSAPTLASSECQAVHGSQQLFDPGPFGAGLQRYAQPAAVYAQFDQVPGPHWEVRVEQHLLRDVADGMTSRPPTGQRYTARRNWLEAEDRPQQRGLAGTVHPDEACDLPCCDRERDLAEDLPARQRNRQVLN